MRFRTKNLKSALTKVLLLVVFCMVSYTAFAKTIYVDGANNGIADGAEWATAYKTVKAALAEAAVLVETEEFVEIWIRAGEYKEGEPMKMINNVRIRGGFAGMETCKRQRIVGENETILSGEDRYRVVYNSFTLAEPLTSSAVLDSVTIANGYSSDNPRGGGMYNFRASPTITNCIFRENIVADYNTTSYGGGIYNRFSQSDN